ncbi:MAG: histidine phosphatase family protein [Candidatus Dormibacteraeota bacterium]|uniref:Histidine phosphatase family protein n=1 Tax=Candidatus Aeolococcus gillhamiae TaxID=3127015 RepID=A0A934NAD5_9BACT|nr:histidine phosphatase family protein [Candidatus Dormibacteraeota bacterium]
MAAQLIHVVRHSHSGERGAWTHDDDLRPLSDRGCIQAERLASTLAVRPPAVVYSSPSLRCVATVLPPARAQRLPLATLAVLYEGGMATAMLERLAQEPSAVVACTRGDILADLLDLMVRSGLRLGSTRAEKGSTWTIEVDAARIRSAQYAPPP